MATACVILRLFISSTTNNYKESIYHSRHWDFHLTTLVFEEKHCQDMQGSRLKVLHFHLQAYVFISLQRVRFYEAFSNTASVLVDPHLPPSSRKLIRPLCSSSPSYFHFLLSFYQYYTNSPLCIHPQMIPLWFLASTRVPT